MNCNEEIDLDSREEIDHSCSATVDPLFEQKGKGRVLSRRGRGWVGYVYYVTKPSSLDVWNGEGMGWIHWNSKHQVNVVRMETIPKRLY